MELPQSRPVESKGGKATHDFLSLYAAPATSQDPSLPQGLVETHDFLRPLERIGSMTGEENISDMAAVETTRQPWLAQGALSSTCYIGQRVSELERNALASAQTSSAAENDESSFKLWDDSASVKGKTGDENVDAGTSIFPGTDKVGGEWTSFLEKRSRLLPCKRKQSFMEIITSAESDQGEDDEEKEFTFKRETSSSSHSDLKGTLLVKPGTRANIDDKSNTIRSKHSATEQRRRSKINDRFQKLREITPNSEQKRDKASFLLEVIDYIRFLQEKVNRVEGPYNVRNRELPPKIIPWVTHDHAHAAERCLDDKRGSDMTATRLDDGNRAPNNGHNFFSDSDLTSHEDPPQKRPVYNSDGAMNDQGLAIESGTLEISGIYSQGLLNAITQALQRSGVNLSQSSISVKINLGKRTNGGSSISSTPKENTENLGFTLKKHKG